MSVKFEKETIRDTSVHGGLRHDVLHKVGERLSGGQSQKGYLAVRAADVSMDIGHAVVADPYLDRLTSNSCNPIRCEPKCSPRAPWPLCRRCLPPGLLMTGTGMAII